MRVFERNLIHTHCVGAIRPEFVGAVRLGESFIIETVEVGANGPVEIEGIRAGDAIAVHIEAIEMEPPFRATNGGPFIGGKPIELEYRAGEFIWPEHFRLK